MVHHYAEPLPRSEAAEYGIQSESTLFAIPLAVFGHVKR